MEVGLRINADYNVCGGKPLSSKYGVDEESLLNYKYLIDNLKNIKKSGKVWKSVLEVCMIIQ